MKPEQLKNTFIDFELADGAKVKMTLCYYWLLQLKTANKAIYDRYNKIAVNGPQEDLDSITMLYAAYLCAFYAEHENLNGAMNEQDFICSIDDHAKVAEAVKHLWSPKKK